MPEAPECGGIQSGVVDDWLSGLVVEYLSGDGMNLLLCQSFKQHNNTLTKFKMATNPATEKNFVKVLNSVTIL